MSIFNFLMAMASGNMSPEQLDQAATALAQKADPAEFMQGIEQAKPVILGQMKADPNTSPARETPNVPWQSLPPSNVGKGPNEVSLAVPENTGIIPKKPTAPVQPRGALTQPTDTAEQPDDGEAKRREALMALAGIPMGGNQAPPPAGVRAVGNASPAQTVLPDLFAQQMQGIPLPGLAQYLMMGGRNG